ncbi:ABSCISIC ACID-INSENSITIVE 5-like protein 1 [Diospyros lotus]|uniref:ABSCISIC ACID-INSENSITIVE 5-like protein 1 n=1 Tax=Diospyros lotus TaxID=55363 RepID=UPI00224F64FA|nr:ABSCISIC ACID-INSENSITIVE 5-like protein 1 [Diospyros lotus]
MEGFEPESFAHGDVKLESSRQALIPMETHSNSSPNTKNPIFSITLDEFQRKNSGMSLESMNMEELRNCVWNVEANKASLSMNQNEVMMAVKANQATSIMNQNEVMMAVKANQANSIMNQNEEPDLPLEESFSLTSSPNKRTMDEIWADIQINQSPANNLAVNNVIDFSEGDTTLGEITLEDLLVKLGVIQGAEDLEAKLKEAQGCPDFYGNFASDKTSLDPTSIGATLMQGVEFQPPNAEINIPAAISPIGFPPSYTIPSIPINSHMHKPIPPWGGFAGESSNDIGNGIKSFLDGLGVSLKRKATNDELLELAAERRQRKMIKNRASAARSRARKQAYTTNLETELHQLKDENAQLKHTLAEVEEILRRLEPLKERESEETRLAEKEFKVAIRRTSSAGW